jgi:hypothetical protein
MYHPYTYVMVIPDELLFDTLVNGWPTRSIFNAIALSRFSVVLAVEAEQPVNVTVPKSAKAFGDVPTVGSSTIHSALWPASSEEELGAVSDSELGAVSDSDTFSPVDWLFIVTVPLLRELASMVTVITLLADREIPEK